MFQAAHTFILVLLAALPVVFASNSPIVLDMGKHSDAATEMLRSYVEEMADVPGLGTLHESQLSSVEDGSSKSYVVTMPYFPMIVYLGGVSMSLIDISIEGLDLVQVPSIPDLFPVDGIITIPIRAPSLSFNAGSYVAGGMIKDLPFVGTGSSSAQIGLTNLNITLSYEVESRLNFCPKVNSTNFEMTLDQLSMNFEDLNPGQDSGDLINGVLNSITDDVTKLINLLLNEPAGQEILERLIGSIITNQIPLANCTSAYSSVDKQAEDFEGGMGGQGNFLAEFTEVLEKIISMLSGRMEILNEAEAFLELVGDVLPEMNLGDGDLSSM